MEGKIQLHSLFEICPKYLNPEQNSKPVLKSPFFLGGREVDKGPTIKMGEKNVYSTCNYIHVLKYLNLKYFSHSFV